MLTRVSLVLALASLYLSHLPAQVTSSSTYPGSVASALTSTSDGKFVLDGQAFQIRAGEMHYPRVARADWRDRMKKMKAMGLNTLTTYVFWDLHEPSPGVYDFTGQNDLAEYMREAQQEGLYVILRPGPYVCAEWDFGGFPWWLLKDHKMVIRASDPAYLAAVNSWFTQLGKVVHPFMRSQGGPIIAVQVENEYGAFGDDHAYMEAVRSALRANGMGDGYLYTADNPPYFSRGSLSDLPIAVNFAPDKLDLSFAALKAARHRRIAQFAGLCTARRRGKHLHRRHEGQCTPRRQYAEPACNDRGHDHRARDHRHDCRQWHSLPHAHGNESLRR